MEYTDAIEIDPEHSAAYNSRGFAYYEWGRYDKAIADYDKAIAIDPNYVSAYIKSWKRSLGESSQFRQRSGELRQSDCRL